MTSESTTGTTRNILFVGASTDGKLYGKAFENWYFHELTACNMYSEAYAELFYWRLTSGTKVDFIINDMEVAVEAKASQKIHAKHLKGLRNLKIDHPSVKRRMIICLEEKYRETDDGIEVVPARDFVEMLWRGDIFF